MQQDKDRGSQWLFTHFGQSLLRLAGVRDLATCRAVKGDLVAPRRYPDGLLEVTYTDRPARGLYLLEIETYAGPEADRQVFEDLMVIAADRRQLPEAVLIVLRPRGNARATGRHELTSAEQGTTVRGSWRIVELWTLKAEDLLAENDVGLLPWVPLTQMQRPGTEILGACRDRILRDAPTDRREGLLVVTKIMADLAGLEADIMGVMRDPIELFDSPWGRKALDAFEKRVRAEVMVEAKSSAIWNVLTARFGSAPEDLRAEVAAIKEESRLTDLHRWAAICPDLAAFRARLQQG